MEPKLLNMFHTLLAAKEIWATVNEMFYDGSDISQLYELWFQATRLVLSLPILPKLRQSGLNWINDVFFR